MDGGDKDWQLHLEAVVSLVSSKLTGAIFEEDEHPSHHPLTGIDNSTHWRSDRTGLRFLSICILWFDLFVCLSSERTPLLPYQSWLNIPGLHMADVMGCENWVMHAIGDIAVLRQWKDHQQTRSTLSIIQLASKAQSIQENLEQALTYLEVSAHCTTATTEN